MYRILLSTPNFPKDLYSFYKKAVTVVDQINGTETTTLEPYETDNLVDLQNEYLEVIKKYPTSAVLPIDMLATELDVIIVDETN